MGLDIIGAGFGRTGTLSLKIALETLGFDRCYHMAELANHAEHAQIWSQAHRGEKIDWDALFEGYRASVDWPSCNLWREQLEHYPNAWVILTRRDPERWYESVMNTIYASSESYMKSDVPDERARGQWASDIIWEYVFDGRMKDKRHVIDVYERHNRAVIERVPAECLLVYEPPYGWESLCAFLGLPVPDEPYPRSNSTEAFRARSA